MELTTLSFWVINAVAMQAYSKPNGNKSITMKLILTLRYNQILLNWKIDSIDNSILCLKTLPKC